MKNLKYTCPWSGEQFDVILCRDTYSVKNRMYLGIYYKDEEFNTYMPYADITVNIPDAYITTKTGAFVDDNNLPNVKEFLMNNRLAKPTTNYAYSGFCCYQEWQFDMDRVAEFIS